MFRSGGCRQEPLKNQFEFSGSWVAKTIVSETCPGLFQEKGGKESRTE